MPFFLRVVCHEKISCSVTDAARCVLGLSYLCRRTHLLKLAQRRPPTNLTSSTTVEPERSEELIVGRPIIDKNILRGQNK